MKNKLARSYHFFPEIARDDFLTEINSFFDDMFSKSLPSFNWFFPVSSSKSSYPKLNVKEELDKYVIEATVPGLEKKDVKIKVKEGNILVISGEKEGRSNSNETKFVCREIHYSNFRRTIFLGENTDVNKITSSMKDGIVTIEIPKKEVEKKKEGIEIEIK